MDGSNVDYWSPFLQWGPLGLMVVMMISGILAPKWAYDSMKADRDQWRTAYETERTAHQGTRDALTDASARGDAAIETSKTAVAMLKGLDHSTGTRGAA